MHEKEEKKILIIDDDQFLVDMYAVKFKEAGYSVDTSLEGKEALKKLREKSLCPDILLMDVVMPEVDGFQILETIRKENLCGDPILIVLSNQGQDTDIQKAMELGAHGYIVKANTIPSEVLAKVTEIIESKALKATTA